MEAETVKFEGKYKFRGSELLGLPAVVVTVVERRGNEFFRVLFPNGKRETVHASDLSQP